MMERLTKRTVMGIVGSNDMVENYPLYKVANSDPLDHNITEQAFEKLAEYEDLEEQGLLLRLPCKVGDTVYIPIALNNKIYIGVCRGFKTDKYMGRGMLVEIQYEDGDKSWEDFSSFGKTAFLTQAEAEQKLKEMADK